MTKIEALQDYIMYRLEYDTIWFNKTGDFCYSQTTEFDTPFSREDVLGKDFEKKLTKALPNTVIVTEPKVDGATTTNSKNN